MYIGMNLLLTGERLEELNPKAPEIERNIINAVKGLDGGSIDVIEPGDDPWVHAYVITK